MLVQMLVNFGEQLFSQFVPLKETAEVENRGFVRQ